MNVENCTGCPFLTEWSPNAGAFPACCHPGSGPSVINLLSEMQSCPKETNTHKQ